MAWITGLPSVVIALGVFVLIILSAAIKVVNEWERGVILRLGRLAGAKGPGLFLIIPIIDKMVKVNLRVQTFDIPDQEAITRDNVTVKVNAVAFFRVLDPAQAVVEVEDYRRATWQIAQTSLRSVLGQSDLDDLLAHRERINHQLQQIIDEQTGPWGVKVSIVEVKDVELPDTMKRAMARQAEAEREKRGMVIHAEGELQASQKLAEAASIMAAEPVTLQLRYLSTLTQIAEERTSTIIFPIPMEFVTAFTRLLDRAPAQESAE
jgi:regulator of protease activity HflC (stomatin/prohibitin superfamily)